MRARAVPRRPTQLARRGSPGAKEEAEAIAFFTSAHRDPKAKFEFTAYRDDSVRTALWLAFDKECAYCESVLPTADIEHYRPKGRVRGVKGLGYYWLASRWDNLLPSCEQCNRPHAIVDEHGTRHVWGKHTQFPLVDESKRATCKGQEKDEEPLLLSPYGKDDPADHIEFLADGGVIARGESRKGAETIRILGLNRNGLPNRRRDQLRLLEAAYIDAVRAWDKWQADPKNQALEKKWRKAEDDFMERASPANGHSSVTKQYLDPKLVPWMAAAVGKRSP